jgi:hypothetical protein
VSQPAWESVRDGEHHDSDRSTALTITGEGRRQFFNSLITVHVLFRAVDGRDIALAVSG